MISITDKAYKPNTEELNDYIANSLFKEMYDYVISRYNASVDIAYSGDKVLLGWNIRLVKSGKTLIRIYPKNGYFSILLVVGQKEKDRVEALLPSLSEDIRNIYHSTAEGMGQRWMLIDLYKHNDLYEDVLKIIDIRRQTK